MTSQIRLGAIFWLLTIEFFLAQFIAQAAWPAYSMALDDISLLGVTTCGSYFNPAPGGTELVCSPLSLVFNTGIVLNGALVVLGIWFTRTLWPQGKLTVSALWLLALGGAGSMLVGIFPLNAVLPLHMLGATLSLGIACFGFFLLGAVLWRTHRPFALYTIATGAIALVAFLLYVAGIYPFGRGTIERVAAWPHTIWYIVTGFLILSGDLTAK
ncbi:hypothetical protein WH87_03065 [Devosia epidermidihirudinis]|uniref:DUF998 domain-containing protein n=1 Tax=Devosia epidermidihirudinis TaxID=1293439 RepID=A0A0F5QEU9_9HYPH|nr:DUF998 domain-containing protein [Devosia epidermidihirudinis]KKC39228.1 hypothetical protein WH87_03065 [Devosia epidermidihirudinis]